MLAPNSADFDASGGDVGEVLIDWDYAILDPQPAAGVMLGVLFTPGVPGQTFSEGSAPIINNEGVFGGFASGIPVTLHVRFVEHDGRASDYVNLGIVFPP